MDLRELKNDIDMPPRIHIYGVGGIGKSTFAYQAPDPFILDLDKSVDILGYGHLPHSNESQMTYEDVIRYLTDILEGDYGFKTLIIDTVDKLDNIIAEYTMRVNKWDKMDRSNYSNKFTVKSSYWANIFKLLERIWYEKAMCIITIGHSRVAEVNEPNLPTYTAHRFATLEKSDASQIENNADIVLFANLKKFVSNDGGKTITSTTNQRVMYAHPNPAYVAKTRKDIPDGIPLDWYEFMKHYNNKR